MKRKKVLGGDGFLSGAVKQGEAIIKSRDISKIRAAVRPTATFIISLLLSMVRAPMGIYPFSYGVVAAASGAVDTAAAALGALVGAFTMGSGSLWQALIIASMVIFRLAVCFIKGDLRNKSSAFRRIFRERGYIRVVFAAGGAAAAGCIMMFRSESIYYGLFSALLGIGEASILAAAFIFFADRNADISKRYCGLAALVLGLCAAADLFGLPFSLGAVTAFFAAVYFSYTGGAALGALAGFAGGIAVGGEYAAAFGAAGLISYFMWDYSRVGAVIISAVSASVFALFGSGLDALSEVIPEIAFACAIAAPILSLNTFPRRIPYFLGFFDDDSQTLSGEPESTRFLQIGKALESLSEMLRTVSKKLRLPSKEEAERICTSARARFCSGCVHKAECAKQDGQAVDSMFSNMAYRLTSNGKVSGRIVPESVARRCFNIDPIIENINSASKRASGLSGEARKSEIFASDYSAISNLMKDISSCDGSERDPDSEKLLSEELSALGFEFSSLSVWGMRARRVYMRGVDLSRAGVGEGDIKKRAEEILSSKLSSPEFSIDGKYISASMHSVPAIGIVSGRYSIRSGRDNTSGDSVCSFKNDDGYSYTVVSDGMGSGKEAAVTSSISAAFLEKLLSASCPMKSALELLNCFLRGAGGECFTTVDLMETDLYTKTARFVKSGAAPSFVLRGGKIYRIHSKTVPVGIMRALDAEAVSFELNVGDTVIMMTDGVTGSYDESPWLYDLLSDSTVANNSPESAAKLIAEAAAQNTGRDDDITVCVMKIEAA